MNKQPKRFPPALRHGVYSGLTLLPTEDRAEFEKLHRDLVAEYQPVGRSEEIIIAQLVHLTWRRENLATYRLAVHARERCSSIYSKLDRPLEWKIPMLGQQEETRSPEELRALRKDADEQVRRELGPVLELIEIGGVATTDHLLEELALIERLDGMIARCLKQLLLVRGVKSILSPASVESSQPRIKRVA
jgi:hypothetical protein